MKKQWCWIFNNLANFVHRPVNLDPSFDDIIEDAGTGKLTTEQRIKYMEALHLNDRERKVVYEGGYIMGKEDGRAEGRMQAARSFLGEGIPLETIIRVLSLTEKEVEALQA